MFFLEKHNLIKKFIRTLAFAGLLFGLIFITFSSDINAQAADTINFQGKIVNVTDGTNLVSGTPSCVAAGADTCDLRVGIYDASTGGTLLWEEDHTDVEIGDYNGVFTLSLNSICSDWAGGCAGAGSGITWGDGTDLYIQLNFDPNGNGDFAEGEIFTRKQFESVPFAYYADVAGSVAGGLDTVYDNDTDKILGVDDPAGLEFISSTAGDITFDLQSTGEFVVQDNNVPVFTIQADGNIAVGDHSATQPFDILAATGAGDQEGVLRIESTVDRAIFKVVNNDGIASSIPIFRLEGDDPDDKAFMTRLVGDTIGTFTLTVGGVLEFGPGGSTARDTNLFRPSANVLRTDDLFQAGSGLEIDAGGGNFDLNNNEAIAFRVENADGSLSVPLCDATTQGRQYYDTSDDNAYVCVETAPSVYGWFNLTQTLTATSTKVVTVGTTGDYASIAAAAGYLNTLTGGIILLAPETHNVTNAVDLDNITLIGANIEDTVVNITGSGSLRSRQTTFNNLTINVDAGITNNSGIDMLEEIGANSTVVFEWVNVITNGTKFLLDSTEITPPTIEVRFESGAAPSGTGAILPAQLSSNINTASNFRISSQGEDGALNFADWDVNISDSGNIITSGVISTTPLDTIFVYPGMNIQGAVDSLPDGGVITILPGTHNISSPISILDDNIKIEGYGDSSVISASGFTGGQNVSAIHVGTQDGTQPANNVFLSNFKLEVTGSGSTDIHGIRVAGGEDNRIEGVTVQKVSGQSGTGTGARIGIFLIDGTAQPLVRPSLIGNVIEGNGGTNYFTDGIHVTGGQDYGFGGIWMNGQGIQNALVDGNNVDYVRETAAVFIGVEDSSLFNNRFSRMGQGSTAPFGIFMGNSTRINMTANIVSGSTQTGSIAIGIDSVTPSFAPSFTDSVFLSNIIDGEGSGGIGFATGFSIGNGTNSSVERIQFQQNIIRGASTAGSTIAFDVDGVFEFNSISNNIFSGGTNNWDIGINIQDPTALQNLVRGNKVNSNVTTGTVDNGTGTIFGVGQHQDTVAPTVNDDSLDGYGTGTLWIDTVSDTAYVLVDNAVGAANWQQVGVGGGSTDLDIAYGNDIDKILNVDNAAGLEYISTTAGNITFDLQSTGDFIIEDSGTPYFSVLDTGLVGIGTNTPQSALDINSAGSAGAPALIFQSDTDTGIFNPAANILSFSAAGTEQFRITADGLQFIGTAADPGAPVDGTLWYNSTDQNFRAAIGGRVQELQTVAIAQAYEGTTTVINAPTPIDWDGAGSNRIIDPEYSHSTAASPSQITVNDTGLYEISYNVNWDTTANSRRTAFCQMYVNGAPVANVSQSYGYSRNNTDDKETNSATYFYQFTAGDFYEIQCSSVGSAGSIETLAGQSYTAIQLIRRN